MGLIVYVSDFGPLHNPWLSLWWDMLVVAVFCLVIYYRALSVSLTRRQIEQMIGEVVIPEEEGLAGNELIRSSGRDCEARSLWSGPPARRRVVGGPG